MSYLTRILPLTIALAALALAAPGCRTPPGPVNDPTGSEVDAAAPPHLNCGQQVLQHAIASATARVNAVLAESVSTGAAQAVVMKNLADLATDIGPSALACAVHYLADKLGFDAAHAESPAVRADYVKRAELARAFIQEQGYTFAGEPPN